MILYGSKIAFALECATVKQKIDVAINNFIGRALYWKFFA